MESFNSEWIGDPSTEYLESVHTHFANVSSNINYCIDSDSPQLSGDSQECLSELTLKSKKSESNVVKFNLTSTTLAKKRLQAYSQQIHKIPIKEEKSECKEQRQDLSFKRKKDMNPIEKAKAVIREIEEEKRKEIEEEKRKELIFTSFKYLHESIDHSRESTEPFRRREIKQRNYRRTDSTLRKSASPEIHHRSKTRVSPVHKYPRNWLEYNSNRYDDKTFSKKHWKNKSVKDVLDNLYNFHLPSPYIESFRCSTENGTKDIPPFFLKRTTSKPSIVYSVNCEKIMESFLTRDQLFQLVSDERRQVIKNLMSSHSKSQPLSKMVESKPWYNKIWRKHADAECKILEKSVGLSFLQTYSDEEEDNETEEILICSSINNANNSKIDNVQNNDSFTLTKHIDKSYEDVIETNESKEEELQSRNETFEKNNASPILNESNIPEDEAGILTPELPLQLQESFRKSESNNVELDNPTEVEETVNESKSKHKSKKKKTAKRKMESTPKKKKKKRKQKRKTSEEHSDNVEEKTKRIKRKKAKDKKEKISKNKKEIKKRSSSKDLKSKKKAKISKQLGLKDKYSKKKKTETAIVEKKSPLLDDLRKKLKKKHKKKKDSKGRYLDKEELSNENHNYPDKHDEQKTIDLIAINKSYKLNLELDIQKKLEFEKDRSKTPKNTKKQEFDDEFTLQKDIFINNYDAKTPDTNEYRGNWEKDSFGSVEESTLWQTKLNSSWESDDDIFEKQERPNEHIRSFCEVSNFEIPLNIKPFKKRDIDDASKMNIEGTTDDEKSISINLPVKETSGRIDKIKLDADEINKSSKSSFKIATEEIKKPSRKFSAFKIDPEEIRQPSRKIEVEDIKKTSKRIDAFKIDVEEIKKPSKRIEEFKIDVEEIKKPSKRTEEFKIDVEEIKKPSKRTDVFKIDVEEIKKSSKEIDESKLETEDTKRTSGRVEHKIITEKIQEAPRRIDDLKIDSEEIVSMNLKVQEISDKISNDAEQKHEIRVVPGKKRRWDKTERESTPNTSLKANNASVTSLNSSSVSLEHEYVEFMKAVTSNTDSLSSNKIDDSVISLSSNESVEILSSLSSEKVQERKPECVISPQDIPFIPMPDEVKPVPVPSPVVENISKPLISFNLSANIVKGLGTPIVSHPNKSLETTVFSENEDSFADSSTQAITDDVSSSNVVLEAVSEDIKNDNSPKKPFTFTGLVLPTKKTLLDNSNLKLCDSDDEIDKTMKPLDEIRKEHLNESDVERTMTTEPTLTVETAITIPKPEEHLVEQQRLQQKRLSPPPKPVQSDSVKSERKDLSPKRSRKRESSPRHKNYSPKREMSPKRRRRSPERHRDRERDRDRRRKSSGDGGRRYSSRRTRSPSYSPRRRSPRRSMSPRSRSSTKSTSKNTDRFISNSKKSKLETSTAETHRQKSPSIASPLEGLKRSVADSTISDDSLLPQPNLEEYTQSPLPQFFNANKSEEKRISLDDRLTMELGWRKDELQPISTTYDSYHYSQNEFLQASQVFSPKPDQKRNNYLNANESSNFVQVGNMVQIVPKDLDSESELVQHVKKSQILQVGNMLQIVPTEMPPQIPPPPHPRSPPKETPRKVESSPVGNVSSDLELKETVTERKAERDKRKQDREARRKEKENRRREKEKQRNVKMKQKTENMIMRALQLEVGTNEEVESEFNESGSQWPPSLNASGSKDALNKSILVHKRRRSSKGKSVQFADGIRPGDGTSSAGEDLCSSPPSKVLPKEKRYTRTKLRARNLKKKVKVKIIKHNPGQTLGDDGEDNGDEEDDHLPPPSPPPGSPPPHIFPPRIKTVVNNMQAYIPNVLGNQNQPVYTQAMNPLMATQALSRLQHPPPLPDSHMPVHHLTHYPLSSVVAPPPPPVVTSESSFGTTKRNPHLYKYTTH